MIGLCRPVVKHPCATLAPVNRSRLWAFILTMAAVAVIVGLARRAAPMTPTSDTAVIETYTTLAASGRLLDGPYSRFQWHHPGPLPFYLLAPVYVLAGRTTVALFASALVLNLGVLAFAFWTVRRHAHPLTACAVAVALTLFVCRVPGLLVSPWNPHLPVLALAAALLACAASATGVAAGCLGAAVLVSFAAQGHVAVLPLSVGLGLTAVFGFVLATVITGGRAPAPSAVKAMVGTIAATDGLVLLLWMPVLLQQVLSADGNVGQIWRYFIEETHETAAFGVALSAWADMMTGLLRPDFYLAHGWTFVESPVLWAEIVAGLQCATLPVAAWLAHRGGRRFERNLGLVLLAASVIALISATRSDREVYDHVVFWIAAIGALNLGLLAAETAQLVVSAEASGPARRHVATIAMAAFALAATVGGRELQGEVEASHTPGAESRAAAAVADALATQIPARGLARPLVRFDQDAWGMAAGVVLDLQKRGMPVSIEDDWLAMYPVAFKVTGDEAAEIALLGAAEHLRRTARPATVIATSGDQLFAHLSR